MAFLRFASAVLAHPHVSERVWGKIRSAGRIAADPSRSLVAQASDILGSPFDPNRYLLSHATIVASVTVQAVPGVKVGSAIENGKRIDRRWIEYGITPETDKYINNNNDAWSREVLAASYRTFIGGQNFLEHVQIDELSKGRIIDAVLRDIGDSLYADILIATDRKNRELVADIESGRMSGLSMGCTTLTTQCTKCGHVADDETQLCSHIRYEKGNIFIDKQGVRRRVAELCGHHSIDPNAGVTFIEASWVANPAFTGAVARNIISPSDISEEMARQATEVLSLPPLQWLSKTGLAKAASLVAQDEGGFDFGDDGGGEGGDAAPPPEEGVSVLKDLEDSVVREVVDRVEKKIRDEISGNETPSVDESPSLDDTLVKEASRKVAQRAYLAAVSGIVRTASGNADVMNRIAVLDHEFGIRNDTSLYRTVLRVGSLNPSASVENYLNACRGVLGTRLDKRQARALIRLGRILSHAEACLRPIPRRELKRSPR